MLRYLAIVLIVLWLLGLLSPWAVGNLLHGLLVIALILFLLEWLRGRR